MKIKQLSVFFPSFNEEGNIQNAVNKSVRVLQDLGLEYEIIIVNDGSTDNTKSVAEDLAKKNSKIKVISHPKNLGYGEALKSGFYNAKYDTIVYTDGDGQFDFAEVTKFLEKIENENYDLVIGYRIKRQDPFFRRLFGKGWRLTLLAAFGLTLKDVDCGFKMIKRKVLRVIPHLESQRGAMINAELAIKAQKYGFKVTQVGVNHYPRISGRPTGASVRVIMKSYIDLIRLWWKLKDQKLLFLLLVSILLLAVFLRFYRLSEYMTFLGDEGRDALIMKKMWSGDIPLIGPPTSVGNIYLGPLYYYMMFIPMVIFNLNPVSAAAMNAIIGVLIVGFIYYLGKVWFGRVSGLISSYLYAISPVNIIYSRSSWNPNPTPFFALIAMFGFYKAHQSKNFGWLILTGASTAAALQMHYLALILIPVFALLWLIEVISKKPQIKNLISGTLLGILAFIFVMSPLVWFDLRHNFLNYRAITELISGGATVQGYLFNNLVKIPDIYGNKLIGRYIAGENLYLTLAASILILIPLLKKSWPTLALGVWMIVGLLGMSFYKGSIYDHYLGSMNPAPFLLFGALAGFKNKQNLRPDGLKKILIVAVLLLLIVLTFVNLQKSPLNNPPNNQLKRTQEIARYIINETGGKDFNFGLLAKNNYDAAYQFYLDQYGHKPKMVPFDKTDQLFVVCEDESCDPTHSPKYELAAFGMSKIEWMEELSGVKIYKLVPNPSGKP